MTQLITQMTIMIGQNTKRLAKINNTLMLMEIHKYKTVKFRMISPEQLLGMKQEKKLSCFSRFRVLDFDQTGKTTL